MADVEDYELVRAFLIEHFHHRLLRGAIREAEYYRRIAAMQRDKLAALSKQLFVHSPHPVELSDGYFLRLIYLLEIDGSEFPFLFASRRRQSRSSTKPTCFVGHRFVPAIEIPLRLNLAHVLEPHGIKLKWSAQDLSATDVFAGIVKGIRSAGMCFFDNLGTANKPNVYIEVGIAYALEVPMIVTEYIGPPLGPGIGGGEVIPSDLQGLFRIQYASYSELFRKLYFGLPDFIVRARQKKR